MTSHIHDTCNLRGRQTEKVRGKSDPSTSKTGSLLQNKCEYTVTVYRFAMEVVVLNLSIVLSLFIYIFFARLNR